MNRLFKNSLKTLLGFSFLLFLGIEGTPALAQEGPVLMYYGVELVSNDVFRGDDRYVRVFAKDGDEHGSINMSPAVHPELIVASAQISLHLRGTFALNNRPDDSDTPNGSFFGFERDDEIDYTLSYYWKNRLGRFTGALIYYTLLDERPVGAARNSPATKTEGIPSEIMFGWEGLFSDVMTARLNQFSTATPGRWYTSLGAKGVKMGGFGWDVEAGFIRTGPKNLTTEISYDLGDFTIAFNAAYRPDPNNLAYNDLTAGVQGYDDEGKYTPDPNDPLVTKDYPPTIFWISINYGVRQR